MTDKAITSKKLFDVKNLNSPPPNVKNSDTLKSSYRLGAEVGIFDTRRWERENCHKFGHAKTSAAGETQRL